MTKMRRWVPVAMVMVMVLGAWWRWQRPPVDSSESVHRSVETLPQGASVHHHPGSSERELGVAPPGRGKRTIAQEDPTTEQRRRRRPTISTPRAPHEWRGGRMGGESSGNGLERPRNGQCGLWHSSYCPRRASICARASGDCDFQLISVGPIEKPVSEMQVVTVTAGETTTVEWVLFSLCRGRGHRGLGRFETLLSPRCSDKFVKNLE